MSDQFHAEAGSDTKTPERFLRGEASEEILRVFPQGIASAVHYPSPLHRQPALAGIVDAKEGDFPIATAAAREVLCLPIYPELTNEEVETVCAAVRGFFTA